MNVFEIRRLSTKVVWFGETNYGRQEHSLSARSFMMILWMDEMTLIGRKFSSHVEPCFFGINVM
jgi:hypothetical protein